MREQMHYWLVEQVHGNDFQTENIEHWCVVATTPQEALQKVCDTEGAGIYFGPDELEVIINDYYWAAADGSMVCVDIKKLDIPVPTASQV